MLKVFYEDQDVIVVKKPVGTESQAVHSFAPDMVSEIKKHIHRLSTENGGKLVEDYVGVIQSLWAGSWCMPRIRRLLRL